jgi:hypothetical protein
MTHHQKRRPTAPSLITTRDERGARALRVSSFEWGASTPDELIALRFFVPLTVGNANRVAVDDVAIACGTTLVEHQIDTLAAKGLLERHPSSGTVRLTSLGTCVLARAATPLQHVTSPLDRQALETWNALRVTEREIFRFFATEPDGTSTARVDDLVQATRTVIVDCVLEGLGRRHLLVRHPMTATVALTRTGLITAAYADAVRNRSAVPLAQGRLRSVRRRQFARTTRSVWVCIGVLAALYPVLVQGPMRLPPGNDNVRLVPASASQPIALVDLSTQPPHRAALPNGASPGQCRRGAEVIRHETLWANGEYLGIFRHYASFRCGVAWWTFENDEARYYYGAVHIRLHANDFLDDIEVLNNAKTLIGRVTSTIGTCVGYDIYLVLRDGTRSQERALSCDAASPGAGVAVQ